MIKFVFIQHFFINNNKTTCFCQTLENDGERVEHDGKRDLSGIPGVACVVAETPDEHVPFLGVNVDVQIWRVRSCCCIIYDNVCSEIVSLMRCDKRKKETLIVY